MLERFYTAPRANDPMRESWTKLASGCWAGAVVLIACILYSETNYPFVKQAIDELGEVLLERPSVLIAVMFAQLLAGVVVTDPILASVEAGGSSFGAYSDRILRFAESFWCRVFWILIGYASAALLLATVGASLQVAVAAWTALLLFLSADFLRTGLGPHVTIPTCARWVVSAVCLVGALWTAAIALQQVLPST